MAAFATHKNTPEGKALNMEYRATRARKLGRDVKYTSKRKGCLA